MVFYYNFIYASYLVVSRQFYLFLSLHNYLSLLSRKFEIFSPEFMQNHIRSDLNFKYYFYKYNVIFIIRRKLFKILFQEKKEKEDLRLRLQQLNNNFINLRNKIIVRVIRKQSKENNFVNMQLEHSNLQNGVIKRIIKKNIRNEIEETGSGNRVVDQNVIPPYTHQSFNLACRLLKPCSQHRILII